MDSDDEEERRRDVEQALGLDFDLLEFPLEIRLMIVREFLERAGSSGEAADTILSSVSRSLLQAVDMFLEEKRGMVIHGARLETEALYMLFASPRWKLITGISLKVTIEIIEAAYATRLALSEGDSSMLMIGKDKGRWLDVTLDMPDIKGKKATFVARRAGAGPYVGPKKLVIEGAEDGGTVVRYSGNDFSPAFIYSLVSEIEEPSAYLADNREFYPFIQFFLNLKTRKGYGQEAHPLKEGLDRIVIVRFVDIEGGEDIDGELKRIEAEKEEEYTEADWDDLRDSPYNYSFSSYIPPAVDPSRKRSGLLILPDAMFHTFARLEIGRHVEKISLHFGNTIVRAGRDYASYKIGSNSILSHQPYNIIFLTDDMPLEEVEKLGIVQTGREERAKGGLPTW